MSSHNHLSGLTVDWFMELLDLSGADDSLSESSDDEDDSSERNPYDTENLSDDYDTDSDEPAPALQSRGRGRARGRGANCEEAGDAVMAGVVEEEI